MNPPKNDGNIAMEGSYAMMFGSMDTVIGIKLKHGEFLDCNLGNFAHDDIIGQEYGSLIRERDPIELAKRRDEKRSSGKGKGKGKDSAKKDSAKKDSKTYSKTADSNGVNGVLAEESTKPKSLDDNEFTTQLTTEFTTAVSPAISSGTTGASTTIENYIESTTGMGIEEGKKNSTSSGTEKGGMIPSSKKLSYLRRPYLILLKPTPDLITLAQEHRTQIIYHADISLILALLDCKPGDLVVESGTGSGSLTSSLADAIKPNGKVYTFEFHEERAEKAKKNFKERGYLEWIEPFHGNACEKEEDLLQNGTELEEFRHWGSFGKHFKKTVDSVFLDLPQPWAAVENVCKILNQNGKLCTFSPCIEQVLRTNELLREKGFADIRTFECLSKPWGVVEMGGDKSMENESSETTDGLTRENSPKRRKYRSIQLPMRGHTSYVSIATYLPGDLEMPVGC